MVKKKENYLVFHLISGTYHLCEKRKYTFIIIQKHTIIFQKKFNVVLTFIIYKKNKLKT